MGLLSDIYAHINGPYGGVLNFEGHLITGGGGTVDGAIEDIGVGAVTGIGIGLYEGVGVGAIE